MKLPESLAFAVLLWVCGRLTFSWWNSSKLRWTLFL